MTFSSLFVFLWLIIAVISSWLPPKKFQPYFIALSGSSFLIWKAPLSMLILFTSASFTYFVCNKKEHGRYLVLIISVLAVLFVYFKRRQMFGVENILIPLGLSYYLFRQVHYTFEQYKNTLRKHNFGEFLSYLLLMPLIIVGPIHRFPSFLNDLRRRKWNWSQFSTGLERAFHGFAKLIIIASFLVAGYLKDILYGIADGSSEIYSAFLKSAYMWIDLYLRFSSYSDIAIGISAMMGFTIIENFNYPFLSRNISDFWKRWHISLTSWCTDYVYMPIAALTRKPFIAVTGTMLVIGLWHEFSFRYLLWGLYHATGISAVQRWGTFRSKFPEFDYAFLNKMEQIGSTVLTLIFVVFSFPVTTWMQELIKELIMKGY